MVGHVDLGGGMGLLQDHRVGEGFGHASRTGSKPRSAPPLLVLGSM